MKSFDHRKYHPSPAIDMMNRQWPNRTLEKAPLWASVDLRDGNQALLQPMNVTQKKAMWALLIKLGFKEIEIGFPSASQHEFDFARWLVEENQIPQDVTIQVLVQAREHLIVRTFEALKGVHRAIVHVYNSTSTVQRERVFGKGREAIREIAVKGAQMLLHEAQKNPQTDWVFQYSPESFSNTEMDYAVEVCDAVTAVWQPTPQKPCIINLPATVESSTPNVFADQVEWFCNHVANRSSLIISLHTHNDRGTAVAAAELGLLAGADRIEGTLLGNGERTGNMDIVTMAMNMYSQGIDPQLDLSRPDEILDTYTRCTGLPVHPRHPWVGELVYTAFSGSHQDAIHKCLQKQQQDDPWQVAYLPIDPRDLGRDYQAVVRVNSQSGKGGVAFVMERDYGLSLPRWMQVELAQLVQRESEKQGGELSGRIIYQLFQNHFLAGNDASQLKGYDLQRKGDSDVIDARITDGCMEKMIQGEGEGAMSAFIDAWQKYSGLKVSVIDYSEHALGKGTGAEAVTYVLIGVEGQRVGGAAFHQDTVSASLMAVIAALSRVTITKSISAA